MAPQLPKGHSPAYRGERSDGGDAESQLPECHSRANSPRGRLHCAAVT
jgi:hypothetical protein